MKRLNKKKGFTIVELVIVIAVVGVLTAVLVPTFVNLTNRAKEAENQTFVRNLNTQMGIREATEGKNKTMYEAMMEAEDIGYNVEKLTPVNGNDVVWDSVANRFAIVDKDGKEVYSDGGIKATKKTELWKIYAEMPAEKDQTYSIYAKEGWKVSEVKNLKVGFDPGKNKGINVEYGETSTPSTFAYSESGRKGIRFANEEVGKDVIIRTNDSSLKAVTSTDGISHYGHADKIDMDSKSYTECGTVAVSLEMKNGSLSVEPGAYIEELNIPEGEEGSSVSVSIKSKGTVRNLVNDNDDATIDIETGSEIGQVIGSTEKITGTGAAEAKRTAVVKTEVSNKKELLDAIADDTAKYVLLTADIDVEDRLTLDRDIIIDGSEKQHSITASKENKDNGRAINVGWDNSGINVTLKNLNVVGPTSGAYTRGLNIASSYVTLNLSEANVTSNNYAINVTGSGDHLSLNISESNISGWGALNIWAFNNEINVSNSTLTGTNNKPYSSWNTFSTVCFEADTTCQTDEFGYNNKIFIRGSTIKAIEENENIQALLGFNGGKFGATNCIVEVIKCKLVEARYTLNPGGQGNKVIIDGETAWEN